MRMFLSRAHYPVTTLGPGKRVGIWFQGCSIRCTGCISRDTWTFRQGETTVDSLLESIKPWLDEAEGISVSGGEPFDQEDALFELLTRVRTSSRGDILVYSGYPWSHLVSRLGRFEDLIDALISEPYLEGAPQTFALRGSDNQIIHFLTPLGESRFKAYDRKREACDNCLDLMVDPDGSIWMAGIPRRGDLANLAILLRESGNQAATSAEIPDRNG